MHGLSNLESEEWEAAGNNMGWDGGFIQGLEIINRIDSIWIINHVKLIQPNVLITDHNPRNHAKPLPANNTPTNPPISLSPQHSPIPINLIPNNKFSLINIKI